jgi:hypothetical protein
VNFIRIPARLVRPGRSGAVIRTTARRRFAAGSLALAAVVAGVAFAASPAHASSPGYCLLAVGSFQTNPIVQLQCDDSNNYENWTGNVVAVPNGDPRTPVGQALFQFQNNGASSFCVDANAQNIQPYSGIMEWGCNASDPYQLWFPWNGDGGHIYENYGAWLQGQAYCLDADARETIDFGKVMLWPCSSSDPYQAWVTVPSDHNLIQNVGASQ